MIVTRPLGARRPPPRNDKSRRMSTHSSLPRLLHRTSSWNRRCTPLPSASQSVAAVTRQAPLCCIRRSAGLGRLSSGPRRWHVGCKWDVRVGPVKVWGPSSNVRALTMVQAPQKRGGLQRVARPHRQRCSHSGGKCSGLLLPDGSVPVSLRRSSCS